MLLGVFLLLAPAASLIMSVKKCCPQGSSLILSPRQVHCLESAHTWHYMNFTFGFSAECNITYQLAVEGTNASCIDNQNGTDSIVALNCGSDEEGFVVPNVNYLRKCCPINRTYDSFLQTCWGEQNPSLPTPLLNVLMHNAEGVVDVEVGVPQCSWDEVVVDHLVPVGKVYRHQSASITFESGGKNYTLNPDEICVDRTEKQNQLVVRTCEDQRVACKSNTCIRKCCPEGMSYFEEFSTQCLQSNRSIRPMRVFNESGKKPKPVAPRNPAYWYGIDCPFGGKYLEEVAEFYHLDLDGSIYAPDGTKTELGFFCVENVYNANITMYKDGDYVFFCFPQVEKPFLPLWNTLGMMISAFFLLLTLSVYCSLPKLQNLHGKTLMCHVACLFAAYSALVTVQLITDQLLAQVCVIMGYFVQFTFLGAFFWLNVISFDIWWNFGSMRPVLDRRKRDFRRFWLYSVYAWSVPSILTSASIVADHTDIMPWWLRPDIGTQSCWFSRDTYGILLFFICPEGLIVISNVVFFTLTAWHCSQVKNELDKVGHTSIADKKFRSEQKKFMMNCKLFIVMGVSWALEVLSVFVSDPPQIWYLSDMANACQGLLIFSIFVLKGRVLKSLKVRLMGCCRKKLSRRPSVSTICTVSNFSTHNLKKSVSESRLSPLPMTKKPNLRTRSSNRLLV
ncbi:G-protein coupled receptor Mth [Halyomorpha halys]|uniref:G-protein coupled receptor Mth n=1 Tax=Halyomorpha halys TaxID=286706 RepID=UPI0006D51233|nr:G-protein coupled receptor Mth-like [Halyomorpha halys]